MTSGDVPLAIGVEHELRLWRGREQLDFRLLIERVAGAIAPLDPGDPRSRRLPSGVAVTADGWEAELATPPLPISCDAPELVDLLLRDERTELRGVSAAHGVEQVTGFSTHLNISVDDDRVVAVGRQFAESCLVAVAQLTEPPDSQGAFVRPRRGRLEIGLEYVEGPRLVEALVLSAACVSALCAGAATPCAPAPPVMTASREKFGWFVAPSELHDEGALSRVSEWARPAAIALGLDPGIIDHALDTGPRQCPASDCTFGHTGVSLSSVNTGARCLGGGVTAETEWLTWHHAVWAFRHRSGRTCRAVVPTDLEAPFLKALDAGQLDLELARMLRRPVSRRQLLVSAQLGPGVELFHDVRPGALVPAERNPDGSLPRVSRRAARRQLHTLRRSG